MVRNTSCSLYHQNTCSLRKACRNVFTFTFFIYLACVINIRHISSRKMTPVGFNHNGTLHSLQSFQIDHVFVVGSLPLLIHLIFFSLACMTNIRHISSHKMTSVGLQPQWYITQRVVFNTSYSHYFLQQFVLLKYRHFESQNDFGRT